MGYKRLSTVAIAAFTLALGCRPRESPAGSTDESSATPGSNAQAKGEQEVPLTPLSRQAPLPPLPAAPVLDDAIRAARTRAQTEVLSPGADLLPPLQSLPDGPLPGAELQPEPMPGFFTKLDMPPDAAPLAAFEAALKQLESGERKTPVRIALLGASGTAIDLWTAYVRRYLQARFGDGGPGIVSPVPHNRWYRHHEIAVEASRKHWTKHNAFRNKDPEDPGWFGLMGVAFTATNKRAWTKLGAGRRAPADRDLAFWEVLYGVQPGGGGFRVSVGGKVVGEVATRRREEAPGISMGIERLPIADGGTPALRLEVVGDGEVRLLGVVAENGRPGIVVDTIGVDGTKASNIVRADEALWAEGLRHRDPVLYALAFGTNESVDEDRTLEGLEASYRELLERLRRALPRASCVVMGPGDYPKVEGGQILPRPRLDEIREIQRRLAPEHGCAFFDAHAYAGGSGAKAAFVAAGLARDDYLHLTRAGYVRFGMAFADALMQHYDWARLHAPED